ncbi:putative FAD-dependent isoamyl alcohol oxidase [Lojkania enalia]|uniref:FAD-dependent isoamyl alcohol oxidase n=1 Tax=Lojkania enalia TaxID=147567 RepID=A0A9P4JXS9_9PLEO|nr:putative FAD-dependent isoamyl alcohol oxidase [Didymosphaeria enalia]
MIARFFPFLLTVGTVLGNPHGHTPACKYIPGDAGWPSPKTWSRLNSTIEGRLIATVPIAHVCHDRGAFAAYNETACADLAIALQEDGAATLQPQPGEIMNPYFYNITCSPFTSVDTPCELGNRAVYSINVSGPADVQAGLKFARKNNIRLVVKNTGLDYMGKSSGKGSLSLWMHNLKTLELKKHYRSPWHKGAAMKVGAGNIAGEVYEYIATKGYRIVGPECGLCGFAGGYTQGVGHSQLTSAYGFAADQVLEWEVVTPAGQYVIATPEKHADLYWALAGGGPGTYGVVLSVTVKAYPDGPVAGGTLIFNNTDADAYWEAVGIWYAQGPSMVKDSPKNVQFFVSNASLWVFAFVMPDMDDSAIHEILAPFLPELDARNLPYTLETHNYTGYVENLNNSYGALPYGELCPVYPALGSRMIPRAVVLNETANKNLMDVYRKYTAGGDWFVGCSFLDTVEGGDVRPEHPPNAVHPAWRESIAYCNPNNPWKWETPEVSIADKEELSGEFFPAMEAATPGAGVYLNEIDSLYTGPWKDTMYGINYDHLLSIKHKYDPYNLMYGLFAVGSDEYTIDEDGRLCWVGY